MIYCALRAWQGAESVRETRRVRSGSTAREFLRVNIIPVSCVASVYFQGTGVKPLAGPMRVRQKVTTVPCCPDGDRRGANMT